MAMDAYGLASMWEAIFADVGVALLAIGNAIRIQNKFGGGEVFRSMFSASKNDDSNLKAEHACCEHC